MGGFVATLRVPVKPKTPAAPAEEADYDDLSSDTTSSWESVDEAGYDLAWETLEEVFEAACRTISVMDGRVTKMSSVGAIIKVEGTQESGAQMAGLLPKRLDLLMPYGDPGCQVSVTLGLQVVIKSGSPQFMFRHLVSDGSLDQYAAWMREQLAPLRESGWLVLVGP